jgi:replicative DNA helicase
MEYTPRDPFEDVILPDMQVAAPSIPHSRDVEEAVLGSVLIDPNCLYDLETFLKENDFYIHRNRWIWNTFVALEFRGTDIDILTVSDELDRRGQLAEAGGPAYLTSLINVVPTSLNAINYGKIVHAHAVRRKLIEAANAIAQLGYDEAQDIEACVSKAVAETAALEVLSTSKNNFMQIGDLLTAVLVDVEERSKNPKEVWGLSTGLPKFDRKTGGLQLGELVYLVGQPGIGKTWLDLGLSMELGKQAPGAVISLEMKQMTIGRRILSGVSGVPSRGMKSGYLDDGDWPKLTDALDRCRKLPIWVDDSSYDTDKLRAVLAQAKSEWGIKWFTLDYALLLMDRGRDETEQSKVISANLKRIVHDLNLCGVVLHSVVKVGMDGSEQPSMASQRGSGQAIHDADLQLFITPPYEKDPAIEYLHKDKKARMATLWCTKGRELEESRFKIHLVRKGKSPFWAEFADENDHEA